MLRRYPLKLSIGVFFFGYVLAQTIHGAEKIDTEYPNFLEKIKKLHELLPIY